MRLLLVFPALAAVIGSALLLSDRLHRISEEQERLTREWEAFERGKLAARRRITEIQFANALREARARQTRTVKIEEFPRKSER